MRALPVVLCSVVLVGVSVHCAQQPAPERPDAGGADAGVDGGSNGGVDGGSDAGPDAGSDAGSDGGGGLAPQIGFRANTYKLTALDGVEQWLGAPVRYGNAYSATFGPLCANEVIPEGRVGAIGLVGNCELPDGGFASDWGQEYPSWQSGDLLAWKSEDPSRRMVYATFMGAAPDLDGGAAGLYDAQWVSLGQTLVDAGMGDAIIRVAHEFNGSWYWYQPLGREAQFVAYYRRIVALLRSVPGESFRFFWNPNVGVLKQTLADGGRQGFLPETVYPGNDDVDFIGPDIYDEGCGYSNDAGQPDAATQDRVWNCLRTESHGLDWYAAFAADAGKPLALGEWGLWTPDRYGGGDDPGFVRHIHDWAVANHVAFLVYFEGSDAIYPDGGVFPNASAEFKLLWGDAGT